MEITKKFYEDAINYTKNRLSYYRVRGIDKFDILHNSIVDPKITINNWKQIIVDHIQNEINRNKTVYVKDINIVKNGRTKERYCKECDDSYPEDYFKSGFNYKRGLVQYRTICRKCFSKGRMSDKEYRKEQNERIRIWQNEKRRKFGDPTAKERMKRFAKKQKEELGDWYIKRLLTRHKKIEVTKEMIEAKRQEVLKMRKDGNWRTLRKSPPTEKKGA